jgi:polysaccharide pyruvyl transferase WcaK-like protein
VNSELFVGTSLHGIIVSMSYMKPFIAVNKKIKKLDSYSKIWAPKPLQGCIDFHEISSTVLKRLNFSDGDYADLITDQQSLSNQSFCHINNLIQNAS